MKLAIEARHIAEGTIKNNVNCAIARAMREKFGLNVGGVRVFSNYIALSSPNGLFRNFPVNPEVGEFVRKFDDNKNVVPTVLDLVPSPYMHEFEYILRDLAHASARRDRYVYARPMIMDEGFNYQPFPVTTPYPPRYKFHDYTS